TGSSPGRLSPGEVGTGPLKALLHPWGSGSIGSHERRSNIMANPTTPIRNREENRPTGGSSSTERTWETGASVADKAKDMASSAAQTAGQAAAGAAQRTKDMASSAAHTATDVASNIGHKAEDATSTVGSNIRSL